MNTYELAKRIKANGVKYEAQESRVRALVEMGADDGRLSSAMYDLNYLGRLIAQDAIRLASKVADR